MCASRSVARFGLAQRCFPSLIRVSRPLPHTVRCPTRAAVMRTLATVSEPSTKPPFHVVPELNVKSSEYRPPRLHNGQIQIFSDTSESFVNAPLQWLRDYCQCHTCFHEVTKQRVIETFDEIPAAITIKTNGISEDQGGFNVQWSDGHNSFYPKKWLAESGLKKRPRSIERLGFVVPVFWTGDEIKSNPPSVDYDAVMNSDEGLAEWLTKIRRYGFSYVDNTPVSPEASEDLLKRIAFIRTTHYGGFYDFTADLASGDTAYTQLGIGAHTDNTYFTDPAGLQMFHLLSHTDGSGGASQLVDGFGAAQELLQTDSEAYRILSTVPVHCHASGSNNNSIQPAQAYPVLVHDPQDGTLVQVRWNTTDRAAIDMPIEDMGKWYDAARKWTTILRKREYWEQLQPGKPLTFDNWRVLHGRSAFTGNRRMCGGYINRDDFISRFKSLHWGREAVLQQVARG